MEAQIQPPRERRAGCRQGRHIHRRACPRRSCFLGKAGCKRDDSGQWLSLPTQTQGPATFPPCGDFLGPPL